MLPWSADLAGRIDENVISSGLLRGNPLGDPHERPLLVYVPPGYDDEPERRYPAVYVIQGFTANVAMWRNRSAYRTPFPEAADAVFAGGADPAAPPAIVVYVDAWTRYGGSQFVDSPGTGRYHSYLCDEIVPWVDARYRTLPDPAHRVWQRWLDWDPVRMVPAHAEALRGLRAIWIDAGTRDEYHLGAEAFRAELRDIGITDELVHFELFDAGHMGIDYRYPMSLAWLCGRMAK